MINFVFTGVSRERPIIEHIFSVIETQNSSRNYVV